MREIKFAWVCRNIHFNEIERVELTDNMLLEGSYPSWITSGNCEIIAKIFPTGLKDKNGKEIYEGDIVEGNLIKYSPLPTMGTIVWDKEFASFANQNDAGNTLLFEIDRIEIIGNIYEDRHQTVTTKKDAL